MGAQGEGRRRAGRWQLVVAGGLVGLGVVGVASGAMAATPFPGPTGCAALSQRFGGGAAWTEIRFSSLPDTGDSRSASARGVTVTITRTSPTSISWQASDGIDVVWVNAGRPPNSSSAAYVYQPEATSDAGLSGIGAQDPLDHVLVCFDPEQPATTAPPVTEPTTRAADRPQPPPTEPPTTAPLTTQPLIGPPPSPAADRATTEPPTVLSVPGPDADNSRSGHASAGAASGGAAPGRHAGAGHRGHAAQDRVGDGSTGRLGRVAGGPGPRDAGLRPTVVAERRRRLISSARGEGSAPARR